MSEANNEAPTVEVGNLSAVDLIDECGRLVLGGVAKLDDWSLEASSWETMRQSALMGRDRWRFHITLHVYTNDSIQAYTDESKKLEHAKLMLAHWTERVKSLEAGGR